MGSQHAGRNNTSFRSVFRGVLLALLIMSGVVNVLSLTGSFYMLQVYDRVLTSHNIATLTALSILAVVLFGFQALIEIIRAQVMRRVGDRVHRHLMPVAQEMAMKLPLRGASRGDATQPVRDLDQIRQFLSGQGPIAIFDLPWIPIYVLFATALHPVLGLMTLGGVAVLIVITWMTERITQRLSARVLAPNLQRQAMADENARNAEVAHAMGFADRLRDRLLAVGDELLTTSARATDAGSSLASLSRVFRMMLQSAMLGVGAYLTIRGQVTGGAIIAASIASSRALAPVEMAIGNWRGFVQARQARARLARLMSLERDEGERMVLPPPRGHLRLENVATGAPGAQRPVVEGVSFELRAGQCLGIVGPSAAGKSSLVRAIVGVWPLRGGAVRIDGATLDQWAASDLGRHIGYVPQDVQLYGGTIMENIARFEPAPDSGAVIHAAMAADVHEMILRLPKGYETQLGAEGGELSAGQRQRVALARALYRDPFLVVLDEPNSNLDGDGEAALIKAVRAVRERGGIVVMVAHRSNALAAADQVAVLNGGKITAFGPRDEVLRRVMRGPPGGPPQPGHAPGGLAEGERASGKTGHPKAQAKGPVTRLVGGTEGGNS